MWLEDSRDSGADMIAVLQRVKRANVQVDGIEVGACKQGLYILLGVAEGDTEQDADALVDKIVGLRIFTDENEKMNLSIQDIGGEMLVVSNFTLLAAYKKGRRPDYMRAARPETAELLYDYFVSRCRKSIPHVACGRFGAHMEIEQVGDGPVTIVMDSSVLLNR